MSSYVITPHEDNDTAHADRNPRHLNKNTSLINII